MRRAGPFHEKVVPRVAHRARKSGEDGDRAKKLFSVSIPRNVKNISYGTNYFFVKVRIVSIFVNKIFRIAANVDIEKVYCTSHRNRL